MLTNKAYDILKPVALVVLPAAGALYFALAATWHLPDAQAVIGSIAAVNTFLGTTLHISSTGYKYKSDGNLVVDKSDPDKDVYSLEVTTPISQLEAKDSITLKVVPLTTVGKTA